MNTTESKSNNKKKIVDGRFMSGIYLQYIKDNEIMLELSIYEVDILFTITRFTLGYRLKYNYIAQSAFLNNMSIRTLKSYRKKLIDKNLIYFNPTKAMSKYELIIPKKIENEFEFVYIKNPTKYAVNILKSYIEQRDDIDFVIDDIAKIKLLANDSYLKNTYHINEAIEKIIDDIYKKKQIAENRIKKAVNDL